MAEQKTVYKVVANRDGVLGSILADRKNAPIQVYPPGEMVRSQFGPFMAFDTEVRARTFAAATRTWERPVWGRLAIEVWRATTESWCPYHDTLISLLFLMNLPRDVIYTRLRTHWSQKMSIDTLAPEGTVYCKDIMLQEHLGITMVEHLWEEDGRL